MSALDAPSGAYPLIIRRAARRRSDPARPSPWLSAGAMLVAGIVLGVVAVLMAIIYALAATIITDTGQGARSLLAATTTALVVLSGTTLICGWAVRTTDQATTALADRVNALCAALTERRDALEEVPQEMARLVAQVRVVAAEVPELAEAVRELTVRIEPRLTAVEQRMDDRTPAMASDPVDGHDPSGLDEEVIMLARRISSRIGGQGYEQTP